MRGISKRLMLYMKCIEKHILKIVLCLFLSVFIFQVEAQVVANFTTEDDTTGCSLFIVHFINQSSGSGTLNYHWNFGADITSTLQDPVIVFEYPGSYTVQLAVDNGTDYDTLTKVNHIIFYNKPTADFSTASEDLGCPPLTIDFQDGSGEGDGTITGWSWDFGDGSESSEQNPSHTYNNPNAYPVNFTVILEVVDDNGCSDVVTKNNFVSVTRSPVANFTADQTVTCLESFVVSFTNWSGGYNPLEFEWDFGDGTDPSTESYPVHTYSGINSYDVQLVVIDGNECSDTLLKEDYIVIDSIVAEFELESDTICPNINVPVTNISTGAANFRWNFGEGTILYDEHPEFAYTDSGQYIISLYVSSVPECTDIYTDTVYVEHVVAQFGSSPNYSCQVPFEVSYTNQSDNAVSYEWHFGDGNESTEENPVNIFEMTTELELDYHALYSDTLIAISASGCRSKYTIDDNVEIILPHAKFTPNNDDFPDSLEGCAPVIINFSDASEFDSPYEEIVSYYWVFGDGGNSSQPDTIYTFGIAGEYIVEHIIITENGCTDTAFATVKVGESPVANFEMEGDDSVCASDPVKFNDLSTIGEGVINGWQWYFSDGLTSTEKNPEHAFVDIGYIGVTLIAVYNGCESTPCTIDSIAKILGPVSTFSEEVNCENPTEFTFNGNIEGEDKFYWDFGDDTPRDSLNPDPVHIYDVTGDFNISLEAINYTTGCSYLTEKSLAVRNVQAAFTQDAQIGCENLNVEFDANNSSDFFSYDVQGVTGAFLWDFGDGSPALFTEDTIVSHRYSKRGKFDVSLIVKDINGCFDTLQSYVKIYEPVAAFTQDTTIGCMPLTVNFTDTTLSDTTIMIRNWYFGDNSPFGDQVNEVHTYNEIGTYSVYLEIENVLGCNDTLFKDGLIIATRPVPGFSVSERTLCIGDSVHFVNEAQSAYDSIIWDFGDGFISNLEEPSHVYIDSGYFDISMQLFDILGCDSVVLKENYIHVHSYPEVAFTTSITDTSCYPVRIYFTDLTQHPYKDTWEWSFGQDQGSSTLENPSKLYSEPGVYSISLKVGTSYGCTDSLLKEDSINISGPSAEINAPDSACPVYPVEFTITDPVFVFGTNWDFYNDTLYSGDTIYYSFEDFGQFYNYRLIIEDEGGGCFVPIYDSIYIYSFSPGFELVDADDCIPLSLEITDTSTGVTQYLWEFGEGSMSSDAEPEFIYDTVGTFLLQQIVLNDFDCIDTAKIAIEVFPLPIIQIVNNDTLICYNDQIQVSATGGTSYVWSPDYEINDNTFANPLLSPKIDTLYTVIGTDDNGCSSFDSIFIEVQIMPVIDSITADTTVVVGESVVLGAHYINGMTFSWSPDVNISSTDSLFPSVLIEGDITYTFTVIDSNQCFEITDDVVIGVILKYSVDVPTAFTPNGDGVNDIIGINGWGVFDLVEFRVYNRKGLLVFETENIDEGWDGNYQGKEQAVGTYVYTVIIESYDGEHRSKTGSFRLLR